MRKNISVEIPLKLDLTGYVHLPSVDDIAHPPDTPTPQTTVPYIYDLYAICKHTGDWKQGHYTACIRSSHRSGWNLFDDHLVSPGVPIVEKTVVRSIHNFYFI